MRERPAEQNETRTRRPGRLRRRQAVKYPSCLTRRYTLYAGGPILFACAVLPSGRSRHLHYRRVAPRGVGL